MLAIISVLMMLALIEQVEDRTTAVEILESLLRYHARGTQRVGARDVRVLLRETSAEEPIMQTFNDRYIEQGRLEGEAAVSAAPDRAQARSAEGSHAAADAQTLLRWSDRRLTADTLDVVLH